MTSIHQESSEQDPDERDLFGINFSGAEMPSAKSPTASFGSRLHAARESRGLDIETCAHALKFPARVLRQLERDEHDGIDSKVYLGSYIGKYGRYLGINEASIQAEVDRIKHVEPALVATGGVSHSRFLLDRYATAATYTILTAVIVVPMIWLGVRGTLDRDLSHLAPLDAAPVAQQDARVQTSGSGTLAVSNTAVQTAPPTQAASLKTAESEQPLLASMAPFPNLDSGALSPASAPAQPSADVGTDGHSLSLNLSSASWVEVTDRDGKHLEYGLLPAGSSKTYRSDKPLEVRIGNSAGAEVNIDGHAVGLDDFRHSNVAHFRVQMQDGKAAAASL